MSDGHIKQLRDAMCYQRENAEPDTAFERDADAIEWVLAEIDRLRGVIHASMKRTLPDDIDQLAAIIRKVDGGNSLGAGALAEAIINAHKLEQDHV